MGFKEKSAALTIATLVAIYGGYFVWACLGPRSPNQVVGGLVAAALLVIGFSILGHALLAVSSGREAKEGADERDRIIGWRAGRNAYYVLMAGAWIGPALWLMQADRVAYAYAFMAVLTVSEIVKYASRLYYYRAAF